MAHIECVHEVLAICAARLESRAKEMDEAAEAERREGASCSGWETVAEVLRSEAKIIRAGCHHWNEATLRKIEIHELTEERLLQIEAVISGKKGAPDDGWWINATEDLAAEVRRLKEPKPAG